MIEEKDWLADIAAYSTTDHGVVFNAIESCKALKLSTERLKQIDPDQIVRLPVPATGWRKHLAEQTVITAVTQAGLLELMLLSTGPVGTSYRRWLAGDVLLSIQSNGGWMQPSLVNEILQRPAIVGELAEKLGLGR